MLVNDKSLDKITAAKMLVQPLRLSFGSMPFSSSNQPNKDKYLIEIKKPDENVTTPNSDDAIRATFSKTA